MCLPCACCNAQVKIENNDDFGCRFPDFIYKIATNSLERVQWIILYSILMPCHALSFHQHGQVKLYLSLTLHRLRQQQQQTKKKHNYNANDTNIDISFKREINIRCHSAFDLYAMCNQIEKKKREIKARKRQKMKMNSKCRLMQFVRRNESNTHFGWNCSYMHKTGWRTKLSMARRRWWQPNQSKFFI